MGLIVAICEHTRCRREMGLIVAICEHTRCRREMGLIVANTINITLHLLLVYYSFSSSPSLTSQEVSLVT